MRVRAPWMICCCWIAIWCALMDLSCAQQGVEKGVVSGFVLDPSGARIAHASVRVCVRSERCSEAEEVFTDGSGKFLAKLSTGTYFVMVEAQGFAPQLKGRVKVGSGHAVELTFRLLVAARPENVDVDATGSPGTSAIENQGAMIFDGRRLAELSADEATFQRQLQLFAGADSTHPAQIMVDGFTGGRIPPKNTIQEVRINQNPFSAQYSGYGMNRIEISTKPGGGDYHGSLETQGYDGPFNGRNPYALVDPPYYQYRLDAELSGPVDRRTSFLVAASFHDMENNAVVNAIDPVGFGALSTAVRAPDRSHDVSGRIDRQPTARNTLTLRYAWDEEKIANNGVGLLVLPSEGYNSATAVQTVQLRDSQTVSAKMVSESRLEYKRSRVFEDAVDASPTLIVEGSFNGGGSSVGRLKDNQDRYELQEFFSLDAGKHFFRFGLDGVLLRDANSSTANYNGMFYFPTLANFPASPTQYMVTQGAAGAAVVTGWLGTYFEDEWKLGQSLTVNYGVRLESQSAIADHADWAPRLGFAWALGERKNKPPLVVLRGGVGIFYDRFAIANLLTSVRQNGISQKSYFLQDPKLCGTADAPLVLCPGQLTAEPPTTYTVSSRLRSQAMDYWNIEADHTFGRKGSISISYIGERGEHGFLSRNVNAPLPGTYSGADAAGAVYPLGRSQAEYQFASDGVTRGTQCVLYGSLRPTSKARLYARYWFEQEKSDVSGATSFPSNQYDLASDYGQSTDNRRHRLSAGVSYDLPFGINVNPTLVLGSGTPFDITTGTDLNGDTIYNDRPAFATDLTRASVVKTAYGNFDTDPVAGQRIIPRNYATGPGYAIVFASAEKSIGLGPRRMLPAEGGKAPVRGDAPYALRFAIESQNLFNHVNQGPPVGVLNSPLFGRSISLTDLYTNNQAANRIVTLSTTFSF